MLDPLVKTLFVTPSFFPRKDELERSPLDLFSQELCYHICQFGYVQDVFSRLIYLYCSVALNLASQTGPAQSDLMTVPSNIPISEVSTLPQECQRAMIETAMQAL